MADAPAFVIVEAANTANVLADPRFGATSVLTEDIPAIFDVERDWTGLDAPTVAARTSASASIA
jgi:hypothetical protein